MKYCSIEGTLLKGKNKIPNHKFVSRNKIREMNSTRKPFGVNREPRNYENLLTRQLKYYPLTL